MVFKSADYLRTITEGLCWIVQTCELQGLVKLFDNHVQAQRFFCRLLNSAYQLQLQQMDQIQDNYPAIDLGDPVNRVAYQITTEKRGDKVQTTLTKFVEHELQKQYDVLKILVLGDRQATYKSVVVPDQVKFDCDEDIIGVSELLKHLAKLDTPRLAALAEIFQEELESVGGTSQPRTPDLMPLARSILLAACAPEGSEKGKIIWTLVGNGWHVRCGSTPHHIPHQDRQAQAQWEAALQQLEERKLIDCTARRSSLGGNLLGWYTVRYEGYIAAAGESSRSQAITFNVSSIGQQGGITAGIVNLSPPARQITDVIKGQLLQHLRDKTLPVSIISVMGDAEAQAFATQIREFLVSEGYSIGGFSQAVFPTPPLPQHLDPETRTIVIGSRQG
jgi:hypothetical protein